MKTFKKCINSPGHCKMGRIKIGMFFLSEKTIECLGTNRVIIADNEVFVIFEFLVMFL